MTVHEVTVMTEPSQRILKEQHISSTKQKILPQRNLNALK